MALYYVSYKGSTDIAEVLVVHNTNINIVWYHLRACYGKTSFSINDRVVV